MHASARFVRKCYPESRCIRTGKITGYSVYMDKNTISPETLLASAFSAVQAWKNAEHVCRNKLEEELLKRTQT